MEKPIRYATIPDTFDQEKHYIEQLPAVDMGEYMWIDVVVRELNLTDTPVEQHTPVESVPYAPELTVEQRVSVLEPQVATMQEAVLELLTT